MSLDKRMRFFQAGDCSVNGKTVQKICTKGPNQGCEKRQTLLTEVKNKGSDHFMKS